MNGVKMKLLRDIVIPAGTVFDEILGGSSTQYGTGNFAFIVGLTKDSSGQLVYGIDQDDPLLKDWFEEAK